MHALWMALSAQAGQLVLDESGCHAKPVAGYVSETVLFDTKRSEPSAEELQQAMQQAIDTVVEPRCVGIDEASCLAMKRQTRVVDYAVSEERKQICSLVMVSSAVVKDPTGEASIRGDFKSELSRMLETAVAQVSVDRVWMQPTTIQGTGCSAGAIGAQLMNGLNKLLIAKGVSVELEPKTGLSSIGFSVDVDTVMTAELLFRDGESDTLRRLGQVTVPPEITPPSVQSCLSAQALGLDHVKSTSGLSLEVGLSKNVFCEGDVIHPTIHSNMDAKVAVFSLTASGTAYLIWPSVGQDRTVDSKLDLGKMVAVPTKKREEERLLVVGVPSSEPLGALGQKNSFCMLSDWQNQVPSQASVSTVSYQILPAGIGDCSVRKLNRDVQRQLDDTMRRVEVCR